MERKVEGPDLAPLPTPRGPTSNSGTGPAFPGGSHCPPPAAAPFLGFPFGLPLRPQPHISLKAMGHRVGKAWRAAGEGWGTGHHTPGGSPPGLRGCHPRHPASPFPGRGRGRGKVLPGPGPGAGVGGGLPVSDAGREPLSQLRDSRAEDPLISVLPSPQLVHGTAARVHRPQGGGSG